MICIIFGDILMCYDAKSPLYGHNIFIFLNTAFILLFPKCKPPFLKKTGFALHILNIHVILDAVQ